MTHLEGNDIDETDHPGRGGDRRAACGGAPALRREGQARGGEGRRRQELRRAGGPAPGAPLSPRQQPGGRRGDCPRRALPDESYYRDPKCQKIREAYVAHIEKTLGLAGIPEPGTKAKAIMGLETRIAKGHWDRVKSRDDTLTYNKADRAELTRLAPGF